MRRPTCLILLLGIAAVGGSCTSHLSDTPNVTPVSPIPLGCGTIDFVPSAQARGQRVAEYVGRERIAFHGCDARISVTERAWPYNPVIDDSNLMGSRDYVAALPPNARLQSIVSFSPEGADSSRTAPPGFEAKAEVLVQGGHVIRVSWNSGVASPAWSRRYTIRAMVDLPQGE
jgi:hypothetical protein